MLAIVSLVHQSSQITKAEQEGKDKFSFTTGVNQWDFIDYDDLCKQMTAIIRRDEVNGIINACSGRPEKLADRVERFIKENGSRLSLIMASFLTVHMIQRQCGAMILR